MAGASKPTASSSPSSSSGDAAPTGADRLRPVIRKRRSAPRIPRGGARAPAPAVRENEMDLNRAAVGPNQYAVGLRAVLRKELRNSDVSQLGRIVLPKREAEAHLPFLVSKDGRSLTMYDLVNWRTWTFKYRFWPNNKSRMYVLENTGDFVRAHNLKLGDFLMIYKDDQDNRFVIGSEKAENQEVAAVPQDDEEKDEIYDGILSSVESVLPEIPMANLSYSNFFDPFDDGMDMANPMDDALSDDLPVHFHDDRTLTSLFTNLPPPPPLI